MASRTSRCVPLTRHILYAYVDGSDLVEVAEPLVERFETFISSRQWVSATPTVVDQIDSDQEYSPGELHHWDLGLNLILPDLSSDPPTWYPDVEAIAIFLGSLHSDFQRGFVIGIADTRTGVSEDLFDISSDQPDLQCLRAILGVADGAT